MNKDAIKGGLILAGVAMAFFLIAFYSSSARSLTIECKETRTFIEMLYSDCDDCNCPPAEECQAGYSCQKDIQQESQMVPPAAAGAWLKTIITGPLKTIPFDDPRWGGRVPGEVYGMENDNYIVFYWPKGGNAVFDITGLGPQAAWYDYRIKSGKAGGGPHTSLNTEKNHAIRFWDAGGGLTVFKRK